MSDAAPHSKRRAGKRFWACFTLLNGILLATTYFMPAIDCTGDPRVNPSTELRFALHESMNGSFRSDIIDCESSRPEKRFLNMIRDLSGFASGRSVGMNRNQYDYQIMRGAISECFVNEPINSP